MSTTIPLLTLNPVTLPCVQKGGIAGSKWASPCDFAGRFFCIGDCFIGPRVNLRTGKERVHMTDLSYGANAEWDPVSCAAMRGPAKSVLKREFYSVIEQIAKPEVPRSVRTCVAKAMLEYRLESAEGRIDFPGVSPYVGVMQHVVYFTSNVYFLAMFANSFNTISLMTAGVAHPQLEDNSEFRIPNSLKDIQGKKALIAVKTTGKESSLIVVSIAITITAWSAGVDPVLFEGLTPTQATVLDTLEIAVAL
ncbi:hypothetical protein EV421DRAFT_1730953 [Armillaria borealis]|uniref:Uncharacterized protein n=1 Tax=Armillaria borealis TaxID=47425 RepID=A0AA39K4Y2_9AGAR|nr:hypothetical protein EV421DRAFT_1730953 [Armillaria borealis]